MLKIKGNEFEASAIKNSFGRRAVQIKNNILQTLGLLGLDRDSIDIHLELIAQRKAPASASWYFNRRNLKYSYSLMSRFIDNLYVIDKVLNFEVKKLISGEITMGQFTREFSEDEDLSRKLILARETLGVDVDEIDFEIISKKYKVLAKKYHPDMSKGDHIIFQKINAAHKLIRKELM